MRRFWCIIVGVVSGLVVAIAIFKPFYSLFLQAYPDCVPGQIDGQCGLASFMDLLYAAGCSFVVWLIVGFLTSYDLLRRVGRRDGKESKEN